MPPAPKANILNLPPIAASAAVNGHPPTGLGRRRRVWLPAGAFLIGFIGQIIFLLDQVTHQTIAYLQRGLTMIVEVRSHRIKPGNRRELIDPDGPLVSHVDRSS